MQEALWFCYIETEKYTGAQTRHSSRRKRPYMWKLWLHHIAKSESCNPCQGGSWEAERFSMWSVWLHHIAKRESFKPCQDGSWKAERFSMWWVWLHHITNSESCDPCQGGSWKAERFSMWWVLMLPQEKIPTFSHESSHENIPMFIQLNS